MKHLYCLVALLGAVMSVSVAATPITTDFRLERADIAQGEPIVLLFEVTNVADKAVIVGMDRDNLDWIQVSWEAANDAPRTPVTSLPAFRRLAPKLVELAPGEMYQGYIVLNQRLATNAIGSHKVHVRSQVRYHIGKPSDGTLPDLRDEVTVEALLPLSITPSDDSRLADTAAMLSRRMLGASNARERVFALEKIFSMPPEKVGRFWEDLSHSDKLSFSDQLRIVRLTQLSASPTSVKVLVALWDRSPSDDVRVMSRNALRRMWWTASPSIRKQIEAAYVARMGKMFDTTTPPVDIN